MDSLAPWEEALTEDMDDDEIAMVKREHEEYQWNKEFGDVKKPAKRYTGQSGLGRDYE